MASSAKNRQDVLGEEAYGLFHLLDIGDLIGVEGTVFRTQRGQISVKVADFRLFGKSPAPIAGKVPRFKRCGSQISSALFGFNRQSRR